MACDRGLGELVVVVPSQLGLAVRARPLIATNALGDVAMLIVFKRQVLIKPQPVVGNDAVAGRV